MNEKQYYYFAYGSNLDTRQMFERCQTGQIFSKAVLKDYSLTFQGNGKRNVANIIKNEGDEVVGALYKVSILDLLSLDKFEGHPNVYKRELIDVQIGKAGKVIKAITYIMTNSDCRTEGMPESDYFTKLERGFSQWGLAKIKLIQSLERLTGIGGANMLIGDKVKCMPITTATTAVQEIKGELVFVYGTLMKGFHNHKVIAGGRLIGRGCVQGVVSDLPHGFPALKVGTGSDDYVYGEIYEVPRSMMVALDRLEGYTAGNDSQSMYLRRNIMAEHLDSGEEHICHTYIWNRELPAGATQVISGDWAEFKDRKGKSKSIDIVTPRVPNQQKAQHYLDKVCTGCGERMSICICND